MKDDVATGQAIRARRLELGLSQRDLADLAGTTQAAIDRYERGERHVRWEVWQQLAPALGLEVELVLSPRAPRHLTAAQRDALSVAWELIPALDDHLAGVVRRLLVELAPQAVPLAADPAGGGQDLDDKV